jgi:ABC-type multidrug transport system fused ATPase/permease subunit
VLAIPLRKFGKRIRKGVRGSLRAQADLLRVSNESMQGMRAVKSATAEAEAIRRFDAVNTIVLREEMRVRFAQSMSSPVVESIAIVAICVLALIAARQIIDGKLAFDTFVLSLGALAAAGDDGHWCRRKLWSPILSADTVRAHGHGNSPRCL